MATPTKSGNEFLVNTTTLNAQNQPAIIGLPDGRFAIAWHDESGIGGDAFEGSIRVQLFNADGTRSGTDFLANAVTTGDQSFPDIVGLPDGRFVVAFQSGPALDIIARIFDAQGNSALPQFVVNTTAGTDIQASTAVLTDGTFVVTWTKESAGFGTGEIFAQRFDSAGAKIGAEVQVNTTTPLEQFIPDIVGLADGGYVITWLDFNNSINARRFSANGTPAGNDFVVAAGSDTPSIAALPDGGFVVTWGEFGAPQNPGNFGIRAQIFPAVGAPGAAFAVNTTTADQQTGSHVTALHDGRFMVTWVDQSATGGDTSGAAIRAQLFTAAGAMDGSEFLVNTTTNGGQVAPVITTLSDGRVVIAWSDTGQNAGDISSDAVRAQIIDPRIAAVNLVGTALGDNWVGTALDDTMNGAGGNDRMDGAGGIDTAIFSGARAAYTITAVGSDFQVTGPDGTDLLKGFEFLQFADKTILLPPFETFTGTPGNDTFTALPGGERIDALGGIDTINLNFRLVDATISFSGNQVIIDTASSHTILTGFETYVFTDGTVNNNDGDPLVDDLFYYSQNHDVWNAHADADQHYHQYGWHEGRNPDAFFDTQFYLSINADVRRAGVDPLIQLDQSGWTQGRAPSLLFDGAKYLQANPDVAAAHVDPLAHFLANGAQEGRQPFALSELLAPNGFDTVYYLQHNPDVAAAHVDPFGHFQNFGWHEGRNPNALFDTAGYLATYTDVAAAHVNPLDHYHQSGWIEGRDPSVGFDTTEYLSHYPDVAAAHIDPLVHFLQYGIHEGRSAFADGVWG